MNNTPHATVPLLLSLLANMAAVEPTVESALDRDEAWQKRMMAYPQREDLPTVYASSDGRNVLVLSDGFMDLGTSVDRFAQQVGAPDVHLPPPLVCGEGEDADNGTLVRVLNRYHVLVTQFSAFPPEVRGGVQIAALRHGQRNLIAATTFAAGQPVIRVFDEAGQLVQEIRPAADIMTPYVIASGRFLGGTDEVLAVAARDRQRSLLAVDLIDATGRTVRRTLLPRPAGHGTVALDAVHETDRSRLLAWFQPANQGMIADLGSDVPAVRTLDAAGAAKDVVPFASAFPEHDLLLARRGDRALSFITVVKRDGSVADQDAGRRENTFFNGQLRSSGPYVRPGGYGHPGAQLPMIWTTYGRTGDASLLKSEDPKDWIADRKGVILDYPMVLFPYWSVWHNAWSKIGDIKDNDGYSLYNITDKDNKTTGNAAVWKGDPAIDRQLLLNSRVVAWLSARNARGFGRDAENLLGIDSLHELGSDPDYSPRNIAMFCAFLRWRWGDIQTVNMKFSTSFVSWEQLDPPRGHGRGPWDSLGDNGTEKSLFAKEWEQYVYAMGLSTRFVDAYRDLLLAGYAPELIKNHRPGFGKDMSLAGLTMGASTGGSVYSPLPGVYGENFQVTSVNTSGQWNFTYGEYQNWWSPYEYVRLKWQWERGLVCANMQEPYPVQMLLADGEPRPGQTGGVGQIRGVTVAGPEGEARFNIAQIGWGSERNGLLKSLTAEGRFEGCTYVVPFHAKVVSEALAEVVDRSDPNRRTFGPIALLSHNDQIEMTVDVRGDPGTWLWVQISHEGQPLAATRQGFPLNSSSSRYRYTFRNQMELHDVRLILEIQGGSVTMDHLSVTSQRELVAGRHGIRVGTQHRGGVSFDVLDRGMVAVTPPRGGLTAVTPADDAVWSADTTKPTWNTPT